MITTHFSFWLLPDKRLGRIEINKKGELVKRNYTTTGKPRGKPPTVTPDKYQKIIEKYKNGAVLQELGTQYGVTRERIRQILRKYNIASTEGGRDIKLFLQCTTKAQLAKDKLEQKEQKCQKLWGCSLEFNKIMGKQHINGTPKNCFVRQRNKAKQRGISWELTLKQWWDIWQDSSHWHERGIGSGKYVMARECDLGPYSADNIKIITHNQNSKESRDMDKVRAAAKGNLSA